MTICGGDGTSMRAISVPMRNPRSFSHQSARPALSVVSSKVPCSGIVRERPAIVPTPDAIGYHIPEVLRHHHRVRCEADGANHPTDSLRILVVARVGEQTGAV